MTVHGLHFPISTVCCTTDSSLTEPTFLQAASLVDRSDLSAGVTLRLSAILDAAASY
jgi:hypothetical protein